MHPSSGRHKVRLIDIAGRQTVLPEECTREEHPQDRTPIYSLFIRQQENYFRMNTHLSSRSGIIFRFNRIARRAFPECQTGGLIFIGAVKVPIRGIGSTT